MSVFDYRQSLTGILGIILTFSTLTLSQTSESAAQIKPAGRQINMLVLGDSVLWGEVLKTDHKSWYQVKTWLEAKTGRAVIERLEAHAEAIIEAKDATESMTAQDGEVNVGAPTISDQIDR